MDCQGLPGIEDLFRAHQRLAKKLSQDEMRALRQYLRQAIFVESESVLARMRYHQAAHEVTKAQFQRALSSLQHDLEREHSVAEEYRRQFGSLSKVYKAREQRYLGQQGALLKEVTRCKKEAKEAVKAQHKAEEQLSQILRSLNEQRLHTADLEKELSKHADCNKVFQQVKDLQNDLLKTKLEADKLRRELNKVKAQLQTKAHASGAPSPWDPKASTFKWPTENISGGDAALGLKPAGEEIGGLRNDGIGISKSDSEDVSPQIQQARVVKVETSLKSQTKPKLAPLTFTPSTPCSTSKECRSFVDLRDCRQQLIQKCGEVSDLTYSLAERKVRRKRSNQKKVKVTI